MRIEKADLIRDLAKMRIKKSGIFKGHEIELIKEINKMSEDEVYGLPESSIADIVETYQELKSEGLPEIDIFEQIENIRSVVAGRGKIPEPLNLYNYIKYRLQHDLEWALSSGSIGFHAIASFNNEIVDEDIERVLKFYSEKISKE